MDKQDFLTRLTLNRPSVFEDYNYDNLPTTFLATDKIPITCSKHGLFYQLAHAHLSGNSCYKCSNEKRGVASRLSTATFVIRSISKFGNKFEYAKTNYTGKDINLIITCLEHGDFTVLPRVHLASQQGCSKCTHALRASIKSQQFIEQAVIIHGNKYDYSNVNYVNPITDVEIHCPIHGPFWQNLYSHVKRMCNCPKCALDGNKLSQVDFIAKSKIVHNYKYNYSKVVYDTNTSMVTIVCKKHGDFIQRAASHLEGSGCKECFIEEYKSTTDQFIKRAILIHGNKYDYSKVIYTRNKIPVEILCTTHGAFWQRPNNHLSRNGCRLCLESKGELLIESILKKYNLKHIREYRVMPYRYRYDFYLPELNIFIEFNGFQHYSPVDFFGGEEGFRKTKERDVNKKQIVKTNNGKLIIITYLHLNEDTVEKRIIYSLKQIYKYWFIVDGKLQVFPGALAVYKAFNLPLTIPVNNIVMELKTTNKNFHVLF